jgi:hypothetical protein
VYCANAAPLPATSVRTIATINNEILRTLWPPSSGSELDLFSSDHLGSSPSISPFSRGERHSKPTVCYLRRMNSFHQWTEVQF